MVTITLYQDIAEQITELADHQQATIDSLVDQALRSYMNHFRREKIRSETEAFHQQYENLAKQYLGKFVAVHNQQIIDHDVDLRTLHVRVHSRFGRMPVLLKQVTSEPEHELVFRSPKFEQSDL